MDLHQSIPMEHCQVQTTHYFCNSLSTWRFFYFCFAATRNEELKSAHIKNLAINLSSFMNVTCTCIVRNRAHRIPFPPKIISNLFCSMTNYQSVVTQPLQSPRDKDCCCNAELGLSLINVRLYLDVHFSEILRLWSCHLLIPQEGWCSRKGCITGIESWTIRCVPLLFLYGFAASGTFASFISFFSS